MRSGIFNYYINVHDQIPKVSSRPNSKTFIKYNAAEAKGHIESQILIRVCKKSGRILNSAFMELKS
jgi:hypothetical protein